MHKRFVFHIIARILLIVCGLMFIPLVWAFFYNPQHPEVLAFIQAILLSLICSTILLLTVHCQKDDQEKLNAKDGLAIVGLSWIVLSAFGALPLFFSGVVPHYTDAFFEIVSGFTTTGSTIFVDIESLPKGILFWRSLTHWLGGMGIIVFCLAILPSLGPNAFQLYRAEAPGLTVERIAPRIKETAKRLWLVYFCLSALEVIFLVIGKMSFFDALCHTFGTMATGGFSTKNASIATYSPY
ncbi:Trk system potassium transporter TrkH, partial [Candidatus Magnetomorum sp. HK-1]